MVPGMVESKACAGSSVNTADRARSPDDSPPQQGSIKKAASRMKEAGHAAGRAGTCWVLRLFASSLVLLALRSSVLPRSLALRPTDARSIELKLLRTGIDLSDIVVPVPADPDPPLESREIQPLISFDDSRETT
eukprot:3583720-Rhodomonas_salina.10